MRKCLISILLVFSGIYLMAQNICNDAVHPTESRISILECCIKDYKIGNVVVYKKDGVTSEIEALAITLNGEFIYLGEYSDSIRSKVLKNREPEGLFQGYDYDYYQKYYIQAKNKMTIGIALSLIGGGLFTAGIITMGKNAERNTYTGVGLVLFMCGAGSMGPGIPLSISGSNNRRKCKKAMYEIERNDRLSLRITDNGVGLVLNLGVKR